MVLLFSVPWSLALAVLVAVRGEDRRVKPWFVLLCLWCAALAGGLWVEATQPENALLAARFNMTSGMALAITALVAARAMFGLGLNLLLALLVAVTAATHVATLWATKAFFTGEYLRYKWGGFAGGRPLLLANPLLVVAVGIAALWPLATRRHAHALDRNRAHLVLLSFATLSLATADYLPHYGIDPFGGPASTIAIPVFLASFAYASVRYRLVVLRDLLGRAVGWVVTYGLLVICYAVVHELLRRATAWRDGPVHMVAAAAAIVLFSVLGYALPEWAERVLGRVQTDFGEVVQAFSQQLAPVTDDAELRARIVALCRGAFGCSDAVLLDPRDLARHPGLVELALRSPFVEPEVLRRSGRLADAASLRYELVLPLVHGRELIGALALGAQTSGELLPGRARPALRSLANFFTVAWARNLDARRAARLEADYASERRHRQEAESARQATEEAARAGLGEASRLATLGRVGASLAHEMNQPLVAIRGFAQRLQRKGLSGAPDELEAIALASAQLARLVEQVQLLSAPQGGRPEPLDPAEPVEDALLLMRAQLEHRGIEVDWRRPEGLPRVLADRQRVGRVIVNLLVNARDALGALPEGAPRRVEITVAASDDRVSISVADSGPGVPPEVEPRLFDPFFTTKQRPDGSGLGLAISREIAEEHGGALLFERPADGGARFRLALPREPRAS